MKKWRHGAIVGVSGHPVHDKNPALHPPRPGTAPARCTAPAHGASRMVTVDSQLSACPVNAHKRPMAGSRGTPIPTYCPRPENGTMGRKTAFPGIPGAKKSPRMAGEEKPTDFIAVGCG